jgi:hypothetical protein
MKTIRECKVHGKTPHGAQNRCLLCKRAHSRSYREGVEKPKQAAVAEQAPDRILAAVRLKGFEDFKSYLAAHTVKDDGKGTWTLVEMAEDLGVPISGFISYHARWIDEQQIQARNVHGGNGNG